MNFFLLITIAALFSPWDIEATTAELADGKFEEITIHQLSHEKEDREEGSIDDDVKSISCILVEAIYLFKEDHQPEEERERGEWRCEFLDEDHAIKSLHGLPNDFFPKLKRHIESGKTLLTITYPTDRAGGVNTPQDVYIPKGAGIKLRTRTESAAAFRHRRTSVATEGNHTILVIRVTDVNGTAPTRTAFDLRGDIFGYHDDPHNLRSQYLACSGGKLDFVPGSGPNIDRGVVEIQLPESLAQLPSTVAENKVTEFAPTVVGPLDQWGLVMYIFPGTVDFQGAAAYTYVGAHHSVYNDQYSSNLLVLMHEVGHNMGNRHSGKGDYFYDDRTCMMGSHLYEDDAPRMCFNAAKSWNFGWYADRAVALDPTISSAEGKIVGIDDYVNGQTSPNQAVILRIVSQTSNDLYVMFNRKKGINSQVQDKENLVTIVEQDGPSDQSWLLAGISEKTLPFRYPNFHNGVDLVVEVCERVLGPPDFARTMVYLDDEANRLFCPGHVQGSKKAGLEIKSEAGDYREKENGAMKNSQAVHNMFGSNWYLHGYWFEPAGIGLIPRGAQILSAKIYVRPFDDDRFFDSQLSGYAVGHATGDPQTYTGDAHYITNAAKTAAKVTIDPNLPPWHRLEDEELVDVSPIIQEIVNRNDYNEGNPIEIFLVGDNNGGVRKILTTESGFNTRIIVSYIPGTDNLPAPPQEIEVFVTDSKDDYKENTGGSIGTGGRTHVLFADTHERQAYRFVNVPIPQGATILEARLELEGKSSTSLDRNVVGTIQGEKTGNSPPFQYETFQLRDVGKTNAVVRIENLPTWQVNEYNSVGDISPIIQELVDLPDYAYGNAMKIILMNDGTESGRRVRTFDDPDSSRPPRLFVRYRI